MQKRNYLILHFLPLWFMVNIIFQGIFTQCWEWFGPFCFFQPTQKEIPARQFIFFFCKIKWKRDKKLYTCKICRHLHESETQFLLVSDTRDKYPCLKRIRFFWIKINPSCNWNNNSTGSSNSNCNFWVYYYMVFIQSLGKYLDRLLKLRLETIVWTNIQYGVYSSAQYSQVLWQYSQVLWQYS